MENQSITMFDENGEEVTMQLIASLSIDEDDYCLMAPQGEEGFDVFRIIESGDDYIFEAVEDEQEVQDVLDAYEELPE